jgi:hypothetical protein
LDSYVRPPSSRRNVNTEYFQGVRPSSSVDLREAYELARGVVRMQPDSRPGHRLVWVRGTSFASTHLVAAGDGVAVAGRHTQCSLVLSDDPFVALRHVLVRSIPLPSGGLALRAFDLHTSIGFMLADRSTQTSIFAEGPVAFGVGEYALVALPCDGRELPAELPPPVVDTPKELRAQLDVVAQAMSPYRANARPPMTSSRITLMPHLVMVGEPLPPSLGRLTGGQYVVTLSRAGRAASVALSEDDVARGVVIGRSEKCYSEDLRRITDVNTSRAHVLILREGPVVAAYDLASTQGTFLASGEAMRRVVLSERGDLLALGRGANAVRLFWKRA